jgi:hypothetical protein
MPATRSRHVNAHESSPRLQPSSSLMGETKKEKTPGLSGADATLTINEAATITQP